jgi:hypothetical protein
MAPKEFASFIEHQRQPVTTTSLQALQPLISASILLIREVSNTSVAAILIRSSQFTDWDKLDGPQIHQSRQLQITT